jgi:molybdopterin/thiamine biosynthesis adenylyltransferase/nitroreductase
MTVRADRHQDQYQAIILDPRKATDDEMLAELRSDPGILFTEVAAQQRAALRGLTPTPDTGQIDEPARWVYYPWRRAVIDVLGPTAYRRLRLDRNRHLITAAEQARLGTLKVGIIGLSVGHAVAHVLAAQGLCGELRLSDFDDLELTNLNRVPASVFDQGVNKAIVAARRIAELDPYLRVSVETTAVTRESVDEFLDGLDVLVEECDSLDTKVLVRESARAMGIPVLMATSDRGLLDVERFDLDPTRPVLHGLLGDLGAAELAGLSTEDKVPHVLRILDAARLSPRMAASLFEVGKTLSTWPQLSAEVSLGAAVVAESVRRIGLREHLPSGRVRIDAGALLDRIDDPRTDAYPQPPNQDTDDPEEPAELSGAVAAAAIRAPSGGNAQPWHIEIADSAITLRLATELTSTMDLGFRGSAVALGAAVFNARVAVAARRHRPEVSLAQGDERAPLQATVRWVSGEEPDLAELYGPMLRRETNRHQGTAVPIDDAVASAMVTAAEREGARFRLLTSRNDIQSSAMLLAAADRIRYLTPHLHAEMFAELRWPFDPSPESGIDIRSLELPAADLAVLDVLRRPEVVAQLAQWDAGEVLGDDTRDRVNAAAAVGVVSMRGFTLPDYARAGSAIEAVWITAQRHGLAVQPVSPVFLYAQDDRDIQELSPPFRDELYRLQYNFRELASTPPDEAQALVLRFTGAPRPSVRSRRRALRQHLSPQG